MAQESIQSKCQELEKVLAGFTVKQETYNYIFQLGKDFDGMSLARREAKFLVPGCISQAWLIPEHKEGRLCFAMDSEALIVRGIMALLHQVYHDRTPAEILSVPLEYWLDLELTALLSMNRRNGTVGMIKQILQYATVCKAWWHQDT